MGLKRLSLCVSIVLIYWIVSVYCDLCQDGIVNQGLCQQTCRNETCHCFMAGQNKVSSCTQSCYWHNRKPCPKITCGGANSCNQQCFWGECNMRCHDTLECSQICGYQSVCGRLVCSAKKCYQVCSNCSMECPDGVTSCEQMCISGECDMTCHAKKCKRMCNEHSLCNMIGESSSSSLPRGDILIVISLTASHLWYQMTTL